MIKSIRHSRRNVPLLLLVMLAVLLLPTSGLTAESEEPAVEAPPVRNPMETKGLDPKLARILRNYYRKTFSSLEKWEQMQSATFEGVLHLPEGQARFTAHKKKPNLYKVVLRNSQGTRIVMGYDGEAAWQLNLDPEHRQPVAMPAAEAQNFIRDAPFGGHLLDPLLAGKKIEQGGIIQVDGRNCYELLVTMPDGERIRYAIDIIDYVERQQVTLNHVNGLEERNIYSDFREIDGMRFPFASRMESAGKEMHRVEMLEIRMNAGLIQSMFQPTSETHSVQPEQQAIEPKLPALSLENPPPTVPFGSTRFGESIFQAPESPEHSGELAIPLK